MDTYFNYRMDKDYTNELISLFNRELLNNIYDDLNGMKFIVFNNIFTNDEVPFPILCQGQVYQIVDNGRVKWADEERYLPWDIADIVNALGEYIIPLESEK